MKKTVKASVKKTASGTIATSTASNTNDIRISLVVPTIPKKKRMYRKRVSAPQQPVVQNIVQMPPTAVAVPNITFGRPQYNFTQPRPYDSPDAGGMAIATFPEAIQNYQSRQEVMGMPPQQDISIQTQTAEGVPIEPQMAEQAQVAPEEPLVNAPVYPAPVSELPQTQQLSEADIATILQETEQRSRKSKAQTVLDRVVSYIYGESQGRGSLSPEETQQIIGGMAGGSSGSDVDILKQLGAMLTRMPPSDTRRLMQRYVEDEINMIYGKPSSVVKKMAKAYEQKAMSFEEEARKKGYVKTPQEISDISEIPLDAKGKPLRGYGGIYDALKKQMKEAVEGKRGRGRPPGKKSSSVVAPSTKSKSE